MTQTTKKIAIGWYAALDFLTAALAWLLFYFCRSKMLNDAGAYPISTRSLLLIFVFVPTGWLILYTLAGTYHALYKKSRLAEFTLTFVCTCMGSIVLMIMFVLNDPHSGNSYYYVAFAALTGIHFLLTFSGRWLLLNKAKRQLLNGKVFFKTLMIGNQDNAMNIFNETGKSLLDGGYRYAGFVSPGPDSPEASKGRDGKNGIQKLIPKLGAVDELEKIIDDNNIQLVVIAMEKSEQPLLEHIINRLSEKDVEIKIQPDILDILSGSVKTSNVMGAALIDLQTGLMPGWQQNIKRLIDVAVAFVGIILLSPLMIYAALRVRFSSKGPVFFSQERIGYKGKPFRMYKFRSMIDNAETDGHAQSSENDPRITKWGKAIRNGELMSCHNSGISSLEK